MSSTYNDRRVTFPTLFVCVDLLTRKGLYQKTDPLDKAILNFIPVSQRPMPATQVIKRWNMAVVQVDEFLYSEVIDSTPLSEYFEPIINTLLSSEDARAVLTLWQKHVAGELEI